MISFHYETDFQLPMEGIYSDWITRVVRSEKKEIGPLDYVFCYDSYLLRLNRQFLAHDYYTDILTFPYASGRRVSGDMYISVERVIENAKHYESTFEQELRRVMAHGVLHLLGYRDGSDDERTLMRAKEEEKLGMFHVEQ